MMLLIMLFVGVVVGFGIASYIGAKIVDEQQRELDELRRRLRARAVFPEYDPGA